MHEDKIRPDAWGFQWLSAVSGPVGADYTNMAVSGTTPEYPAVFAAYSTAQNYHLARVNMLMKGESIRMNTFGNITGGLVNGIKVQLHGVHGEFLTDLMDGRTVKTNSDFSFLAGVDVVATKQAGDDLLQVRWTLAKAGKAFMHSGESLRFIIQDSLHQLTEWRALAQGQYT